MVGCRSIPLCVRLALPACYSCDIVHARYNSVLTCRCACARFGVVRKHAHVIVEDSKIAEVGLQLNFNFLDDSMWVPAWV